ncbi:MAG: signal peptidase I [Candidatus Bathyarchaeia archaeon]
MKIKKLVKITISIFLAAILIVFLVFYRPVSLLGDTYYYPVYTGSMEPAIPVGSIDVIKPVNPETLKISDIVCFKLESESSLTVTHRIIDITSQGFITKGDANEDSDQWIEKRKI